LVDDDPDVRTVAVSMLESSGYEVIEAASGSAALDHLTHGSPIDLMVADVAMPGMNGVELAKIVRHTLPALPVVFMTGYAEANLLPTSTRDEVLRKPFAPGELDAVVSRTMKRNTTAPGPMPPTASPLTGQPARPP
jgi:CheY-like chemotaxis protein